MENKATDKIGVNQLRTPITIYDTAYNSTQTNFKIPIQNDTIIP